MQKITDQALLTKMGMWIKPELTRLGNRPDLVSEDAVEAAFWDVRKAAVDKVADQALLAKIALEAKDGKCPQNCRG